MHHLRLAALWLIPLAVAALAGRAFGSEPSKKPAASKPDGGVQAPGQRLGHPESVAFCADELAHELECKEDFCAAMVDLRISQDPRFKVAQSDPQKIKELTDVCVQGIVRDGAGDAGGQRATCEKWSSARGDLPITQSAADAMTRCWSKGSCTDRVACWKPKYATAMSAARSASHPGPAQ